MFLRFNGLMEPVRITAARHDTSGKLIHDKNLIIFYHIILITEHQIICPKRQNNIVLDLNVFRIRKVFNLEELLHLVNALCGKIDYLVLLIDDKISGLFPLNPHNGIHLRKIRHVLAPLHLLR